MTHQELSQMIAKSPVASINLHLLDKPPKKVKKVEAFSKYKAHIHQALSDYCNAKGYTLLTEHRFHEARKFRFDWSIKEVMIAVEYEGLNSEKSRHTTKSGFTTDTTKYNLAQECGWKVYRFTALNYLEIEKILK
jgi:hypothetical protein